MSAAAPVVELRELQEFLAASPLELDAAGAPQATLAFVDLDTHASHAEIVSAAHAVAACQCVVVGIMTNGPRAELAPLYDALTCTLVLTPLESPAFVHVQDLEAACSDISKKVRNAPRATLTFNSLIRLAVRLPVADALVAESLAYSMLLSGPEFATWLRSRSRKPGVQATGSAVRVQREGDVIHAELNRPERHNAFGREMRDALVEVLDVALSDPDARVVLSGAGKSFCSGGDLDEFGLAPDPVTAHLVRMAQSVAGRLHRCRERVQVRLHGACVGAGIEIPSFAARVLAAGDSYFELPELGMGLIPGAGGTVGISTRIGRWRTAYMVLAGRRIDVRTALGWGLVDELS